MAVRVGVLSAGAWSRSVHLPTLAARDDVKLVVVSRPDRALAEQMARDAITEALYRSAAGHGEQRVVARG